MIRCATVALATLLAQSVRVVRKETAEGEAAGEHEATCGEVFLLDGRDPKNLPSTWSEAREAFINLCEDHGGSLQACLKEEVELFAEFPKGEEPFHEDKVLCSRLGSRFASLADRPLVADSVETLDGVQTSSSLAENEASSGRRRRNRRRERRRNTCALLDGKAVENKCEKQGREIPRRRTGKDRRRRRRRITKPPRDLCYDKVAECANKVNGCIVAWGLDASSSDGKCDECARCNQDFEDKDDWTNG